MGWNRIGRDTLGTAQEVEKPKNLYVCAAHGHGLSWEMLEGMQVPGGEGQGENIGTAMTA